MKYSRTGNLHRKQQGQRNINQTPLIQKERNQRSNRLILVLTLKNRPHQELFLEQKEPLELDDSIHSSDDDDNIPCCVCDQRYPPALRTCISLTIVNWAKCDACEHWTHLRCGSSVNVVRRSSELFCPHCVIDK